MAGSVGVMGPDGAGTQAETSKMAQRAAVYRFMGSFSNPLRGSIIGATRLRQTGEPEIIHKGSLLHS